MIIDSCRSFCIFSWNGEKKWFKKVTKVRLFCSVVNVRILLDGRIPPCNGIIYVPEDVLKLLG